MANIATLAVQLTAKTGRFSSGMKNATKDVSIFSKATSLVSGRLLAMAGSAAAAGAAYLGARATMRRLSESMEEIDKLAKTSDALGIQMQHLTRLEHAGNLAGLTLEDLTNSLRYMERNVADAFQGVGEAQGALKLLNLSAAGLMRLPVENQLT
ncbi:MAG: hypothetical protein KJ060_08110, partial [Candidatus Hydrogenedentes bacterium]|nr:hypothetical protein [Candidatus Hydrogenedentota bacterium]